MVSFIICKWKYVKRYCNSLWNWMLAECRLLNLLFRPLVFSVYSFKFFSSDCEVGMSESQKGYHWDRELHDFESQKQKLKSFWAAMTDCLLWFMQSTHQPWNQDVICYFTFSTIPSSSVFVFHCGSEFHLSPILIKLNHVVCSLVSCLLLDRYLLFAHARNYSLLNYCSSSSGRGIHSCDW